MFERLAREAVEEAVNGFQPQPTEAEKEKINRELEQFARYVCSER